MSDDAHRGGDLMDMAATGTKIPNDAGVMNTIPSKPNPHQMAENPSTQPGLGTMGGGDIAGAADNADDMPRSTKDSMGATGSVVTGTGDTLPAQVESKNLHFGANDPLAKGHDRYDKHARQKESDLERYAGEGAAVEAAPGEEKDTQDQIRDRKGL